MRFEGLQNFECLSFTLFYAFLGFVCMIHFIFTPKLQLIFMDVVTYMPLSSFPFVKKYGCESLLHGLLLTFAIKFRNWFEQSTLFLFKWIEFSKAHAKWTTVLFMLSKRKSSLFGFLLLPMTSTRRREKERGAAALSVLRFIQYWGFFQYLSQEKKNQTKLNFSLSPLDQ